MSTQTAANSTQQAAPVLEEGKQAKHGDTIVKVLKLSKKTALVEAFEDGKQYRVALDKLEPHEEGERTMSQTLNKYRANYVVGVSGSGRKSLHNGDELATLLEHKDHNDVAAIAERALGLEAGTLRTKYQHLNNGQIRMNSGNRIRAALKRGDITIEDVKAAI